MRSILWPGAIASVVCTAATGIPTATSVAYTRTQAVEPGSARLRAPSGCLAGDLVHAIVTGRRIADVTFYVDNKKVKFLEVPNLPGSRWALPISVHRVAYGSHRIQARIKFLPSSQTRSRTLRASFDRCPPAVVPPQLTG